MGRSHSRYTTAPIVVSMEQETRTMTGITLDQLKHLADMLSPADKARLIDHLAARLAKETASAEAQESPLGRRLRSIRAEIVASGAPLLDRTSLAAEVAERRGER
jgi:hypothetical protein